MKEFNGIASFYYFCMSIIGNSIPFICDFSSKEKIKHIRENIDKEILNSCFILGNVPSKVAFSINSKTVILKFSVDNMIKNIIEHPEITIDEYKNLCLYIKNAEYILKKNNKNLVYFKFDNKIYQFVIKSTKTGDELFLTTFHKANKKQLAKDLCRYLLIKKDSSDYEDSKYPSVT